MNSNISYRRIWQLSLPVILSQLGQITVGIADNLMIGHLGPNELAAASFANTILSLAIFFGMGMSFILTPLVGQVLQERIGKATFLFKNSLVVNIFVGVAITAILYLLIFTFPYMGQERIVIDLSEPYYSLCAFSVLPLMVFFTFKQFAEGVGNTKYCMYIVLSANLVNILFNYLFMYGVAGFPEWGLNGAAVGTVIARFFMLAAFYIVFKKKDLFSQYLRLFAEEVINLVQVKLIARKGLLLGIQMLIEATAFGFAGIMVGWLGAKGLAAHQIAMSLSSLGFMVYQGVGTATTILVSQFSSGKSQVQMKLIAKKSAMLIIPLSLLLGILFYSLRNILPCAYTSSQEVQSISSILLIVLAIYQIPDALQIVYASAVRGLADVKVPVVMMFCSYFLLTLPASYYFAFVAGYDQLGIWMGFPPGLLLAYLMLKNRYKKMVLRTVEGV
jgi:MATE family multidrug resistance protein